MSSEGGLVAKRRHTLLSKLGHHRAFQVVAVGPEPRLAAVTGKVFHMRTVPAPTVEG